MSETIYEETIYSKLMIGIVLVVILLFVFISFMQSLSGPNTSITSPAPQWLFFIMLIILFIILNFIRLTIKITPSYLSAAFGIFQYKVPLDNIQNYYEDKESSIRYGGLGIRLNRSQGKWHYGFILVGSRIVLELEDSRFGGFVFTTNNPENVLMILNEL